MIFGRNDLTRDAPISRVDLLELETMNEELNCTNEELETINEELSQRTAELDRVNLFLNSILTSLLSAVIVVDRQFKTRHNAEFLQKMNQL